jgi:hypothetical protein
MICIFQLGKYAARRVVCATNVAAVNESVVGIPSLAVDSPAADVTATTSLAQING